MNLQNAVADIQNFLLEAGSFALKTQKGIKRTYKEGQQALTEADLGVSKMAAEKLAHWLNQPGHILIDEESITQTPEEAFATSEYQWVLDPIDGTAGYALGRRLWGISLGLLHNGNPIAGGIYFPAQQEMMIADDKSSIHLNLATGEKEELRTIALEVNSQIFVETMFSAGLDWGNSAERLKIWPNSPESAVQGFYSALTNQAAGATMVTVFSIWDVAAAAALARHTGHKILSMVDGREWQQLTASDFKPNWKLKEGWLLTHPQNYNYIAKAIKGEA